MQLTKHYTSRIDVCTTVVDLLQIITGQVFMHSLNRVLKMNK